MSSHIQRRLAAVVSMDVVGYSRMIGRDEDATIAALRRCRDETVAPMIAAFDGRVVKTLGDGWLLEFASVVNATRCALEIQKTLLIKQSDATSAGIGNLVDADLGRESAKLQALQVRQQLGVQALEIANQAPRVILNFFQ